jgi:hypothetical protein
MLGGTAETVLVEAATCGTQCTLNLNPPPISYLSLAKCLDAAVEFPSMLQKVVGQKGFLDAVAGLTDANSCLSNVQGPIVEVVHLIHTGANKDYPIPQIIGIHHALSPDFLKDIISSLNSSCFQQGVGGKKHAWVRAASSGMASKPAVFLVGGNLYGGVVAEQWEEDLMELVRKSHGVPDMVPRPTLSNMTPTRSIPLLHALPTLYTVSTKMPIASFAMDQGSNTPFLLEAFCQRRVRCRS